MLTRDLRKSDIIIFDSQGMYPDCDNRYWKVLGRFNNHAEIINIIEVDPIKKEVIPDRDHTQVIFRFADGYNKYLKLDR